ncbi:hypothetical protein AHAS_Ahas15G0240000 [Arachis hypogaea]
MMGLVPLHKSPSQADRAGERGGLVEGRLGRAEDDGAGEEGGQNGFAYQDCDGMEISSSNAERRSEEPRRRSNGGDGAVGSASWSVEGVTQPPRGLSMECATVIANPSSSVIARRRSSRAVGFDGDAEVNRIVIGQNSVDGRVGIEQNGEDILVERWHLEMHTFHLPHGECMITLEDVAMIFELRTHNLPVIGSINHNTSGLEIECINQFDSAPGLHDDRGTGIKLSMFCNLK